MTLRLSNRFVVPTSLIFDLCPIKVDSTLPTSVPTTYETTLPIPTAYETTLSISTNVKECSLQTYGKTKEVTIYIPQNSDKIVDFVDVDETTDFTALSVATFDVWAAITTGSTNQFTKDLTSGITIVNDNTLRVDINNTDTSITHGAYHFELWVTNASSDRSLLKFGTFIVEDTRKFDA